MNLKPNLVFITGALVLATQVLAQVTFYEGEGFHGRAFSTNRPVADFRRSGYNDLASSVVVDRGRWEVCEHIGFEGRCVVLRPGSYDSLRGMGMNDRVSSVRPIDRRRHYDNEAPEPLAAPNYEYRQRPNERVYQADVTSVRAVMGPPEQRCWVEHEQVKDRREPNVVGAITGAVIGGVLGHQVGNGLGKDIATGGGAVAGAVIGANVGRDNGGTHEREVRRCDNVANEKPAYWDVSYEFRGIEHRIQMSAPPGRSIAVNRHGEPRQ